METQRPGKRELKYIILHILGQAGMEPRREVLSPQELERGGGAQPAFTPQICLPPQRGHNPKVGTCCFYAC